MSAHSTTKPTILGIDPGLSGAAAFVLPDGDIVVHKTKQTSPVEAVADCITCSSGAGNVVAYVENVPTFIAPASKPVHSKLGRQFGEWLGVLAALRVRTILVRPQVWSKGLPGCTERSGPKRKRQLRDEAQRRYPQLNVTLDNCDAILLMDYGRTQS